MKHNHLILIALVLSSLGLLIACAAPPTAVPPPPTSAPAQPTAVPQPTSAPAATKPPRRRPYPLRRLRQPCRPRRLPKSSACASRATPRHWSRVSSAS